VEEESKLTLDAWLKVWQQMLPDPGLHHNSHSVHICKNKVIYMASNRGRALHTM